MNNQEFQSPSKSGPKTWLIRRKDGFRYFYQRPVDEVEFKNRIERGEYSATDEYSHCGEPWISFQKKAPDLPHYPSTQSPQLSVSKFPKNQSSLPSPKTHEKRWFWRIMAAILVLSSIWILFQIVRLFRRFMT